MDKVLKIYYSNNGVEAPFPNSELQAELYSFQYDCKRMGTAPTITASVMYPLCLDNDWTDDTYVYFRGEKYYLSNKPSSSYSNTDARYKHELTFVSERKILENVYFTDGILTDFHFFGDLNMLAGRLNAFFTQSSLPYKVIVDSGITTEEKDVEINKLYVNDALAKGFEIFNIPYYFVGTDIRFGYYQNEINETFEYGVDNALLSVNRENSNNKIVTRITGVGSSENIPYYYPNFNESGEHDVTTDPTGYADDISKLNYLKIDPYTSLRNGGYAKYYKACVNPIGNDFDEVSIQVLSETNAPIIDEYNYEWKSGFLTPSYPDYILTNTQDIVVTITPHIFNQNIELNSIVHAIAKSSQVGEEDYVSDNVNSEIISIVGLRLNQQLNVTTYTHNDGVISFNSAGFDKIFIRLKCTFKKQVRVRYDDWYIEYYYDTQYSTSSSNTTVKSTDGTIDEKVYSNFNKVIDYPNGIRTYRNTFTYKVTREVAGYSTASLNSVFKGVFLDNSGDDMSEWNHFIPNSIVVKNSNGDTISHYLSQGNYIHFRNTSDARDIFTIETSAVVQMSTESTDVKAYGVELEYIPKFIRNEPSYDYWKFHDGKEVKYSVVGIKFNDTSAIPDGLKVNFSATKNWIEPKPYLMPSVYRNTKGSNIWYNAVNNRHKDENGNFISFVNLYNPNSPKEHISDPKEHIKPSIVGITVNGHRIDQFADIAFDTNDNNDEWITDDDGNNQTLKHSFFFVKLRRMDFNLFDQALEKGEMTISMTSGHCGSCNFTIMVDEETQKNTVQVDGNGDLIRDNNGNVEIYGAPLPQQQDTTQGEVWIALRKEEDSYGVIMPDTASSLVPIANQDTFVFTNILLPNSYIENAEQKLEWELLKDLKENNEEKFDFSIDFSRIYLAENPSVYNSINENAKVYVKYNGIVNELYIDSYSYRMDADKPLPQIKVDLKRSISVVKNAIQRSEGKIIQYVKEVVVNNQKEAERDTSKGGSTTQNGDISVVQTTGGSTTKVMSQKAVTDALKAIDGNDVEVTQYMGQSTEKVMSQKAVTDELQKLSNNKVEVVQNTGSSTLSVMSQKATTDAVNEVDKVLPFDGFVDEAEILGQTNPYDGGKIYFVKSANRFAYYREEDGIYTAMWNGYTKYAKVIQGQGIIPNLDTLFINDSKVYIWNGETLVRVGSESNVGIPKFEAIIERATITNSTSFSDEGEVVYVISPVGIDNASPIFALKINNVYYRSWGSVYNYMTTDLSSPIPNKIFEYNKQNYIYEDGSMELLNSGETYDLATETSDGLMSADDKKKTNAITIDSNKNIIAKGFKGTLYGNADTATKVNGILTITKGAVNYTYDGSSSVKLDLSDVSGGGDTSQISIVQSTGYSAEDVMSQNATTIALYEGMPKFNGFVERVQYVSGSTPSDNGYVVYDNVIKTFRFYNTDNSTYYLGWADVANYVNMGGTNGSTPISNRLYMFNKQHYIFENGDLKLVSNDSVDLSDYYTKTEVNSELGKKANTADLSTVANTGDYNDLENKPTIPNAVTESTVSEWGFTKNTGDYSKPSSGIPKSDLASDVKTSLGKADTALQEEQYKGTVTGVKMNGTTKNPSNGVVDLGTVITEHQDISGKQDTLVSGESLKTINGQSLLGSGEIDLSEYETKIDSEAKLQDAKGYTDDKSEYLETQMKNSLGELLNILELSFQNKQDLLVSGTNIKTINGQSLLGEGDITIGGGNGESSSNCTIPTFAGFLPSGATVIEESTSSTIGEVLYDQSNNRFVFKDTSIAKVQYFGNWIGSYLYNNIDISPAVAKNDKLFYYNNAHYRVIDGVLSVISETENYVQKTIRALSASFTTQIRDVLTNAKAYTDGKIQYLANQKAYDTITPIEGVLYLIGDE